LRRTPLDLERQAMMWIYTLRRKKEGENELYATDVTSLAEINDAKSKFSWLWIDIFAPDEKESEILSELLGNEPTIVENIKKGTYNPPQEYTRLEKLHDYVLFSIPYVEFDEPLRIYPIFMVFKEDMLISWAEEQEHGHSKVIKETIRNLRDHIEGGGHPTSPLTISMVFREIASKNSDAMLRLRELIDKLEDKALHMHTKEHFTLMKKSHEDVISIISIRRKISTLYGILNNEKELMIDVKERIIPNVIPETKPFIKTVSIIDDAIEDISRKLEFIDSYYRSLDSIMTLQDLASIHRVESSINLLTIVLVIGTLILIVLEILIALEIIHV